MAQNNALRKSEVEKSSKKETSAVPAQPTRLPSSLISLMMWFVSCTLVGLMGMLYLSAWAMVKREGNRRVDLAKEEHSNRVRLQEVKSEFDKKVSRNEVDKRAKEHDMISANSEKPYEVK